MMPHTEPANTATGAAFVETSSVVAVALLERMRLIAPGEAVQIEALTGGVSSDIWLVRRGGESFVLKRARAQLKVAAEWHVSVNRGAAEAAWLAYVAEAVPGSAPRVLAFDEASFAIALEYLDPAAYRNWKVQLLAGHVDASFAAALGQTLGRIHAASTRTPGLADRFANQELFESLRIEPYLRRTAEAVPEVRAAVDRVITGLQQTQLALVHGDFSPKNILVGTDTAGACPVVLDAECATWGDPAFDVAFCLSHLAIKEIHRPGQALEFRDAARAFEGAYLHEVTWEDASATEARIAQIAPALVLARIVGASPVEYLNDIARGYAAASAREALLSGRSLWTILDERAGTIQ